MRRRYREIVEARPARPVRRSGALGAVFAAAVMVVPTWGYAQTPVVVDGRVTSGGGPAIQGALVRLEGRPPIRTSASGAFRFADVALGEYTFEVEAFGYATVTNTIIVDQDVNITVDLDVVPFELDAMVVEPEQIDMEGRVEDAETGAPLRGADVRTDQGHEKRTNNDGRFEIEVWDGARLNLQLRAFGYFGVETVIVPEPDSSFVFSLATDPLVERLIATEVERIEARAAEDLAETMRPLDRADLLSWNSLTLEDVLRNEYSVRARGVLCVVVDERVLSRGMGFGVLRTTLARDVERLEFLFRGAMLRVYTRDFIRKMLGSGIELSEPSIVRWATPPLCT